MKNITGGMLSIILLIALGGAELSAQEKFTLEDAYLRGYFSTNDIYGINWMKDGAYYTTLEHDREHGAEIIAKYDITTGDKVEDILNSSRLRKPGTNEFIHIDGYSFNSDETKILLKSEEEAIYRHSTKAYFYIYDRKEKTLVSVNDENKQMYATPSPQGNNVAYVFENNLYVKNLDNNEVTQVTNDGELNKIINGSADWVYEEEFTMSKAFKWSPDGSKIAFLKFDEEHVPEYNMQLWGELYPEDYRFKYPKAGEKNSIVSIHIYDLNSDKVLDVETGDETDIYLPRIYWIPKKDQLSYLKLNRLQNQLELFHVNSSTGAAELILEESSDTFVDLDFIDDLTYLSDGKTFLRTSEKSGFKHIYHYTIDGELINQLTSGEWEVSEFFGIDEKSNTLFFSSTEASPKERHLYSIRLDGKKKDKLTKKEGYHEFDFNPGFSYYIDRRSAFDTPLQVSLHNNSGKQIRMLEENKRVKQAAQHFGFAEKEFFNFSAEDGSLLHGYMMKPINFDPEKKYPILMFVYGGPGKQRVLNEWQSSHLWWHQYLTQLGYIIVCIDNRGTEGRGVEFKHSTYGQMGKLEVADQIRVARYLAEQKYVDRNRIGIWGWSYGGYLSSLALFIGNDIFKAAIAVAPVTNWRFYDTIYTERYQNLPQNNPSGYDDYSPLSHVDKLKGNYLIVHGTGDDNVHMQNSIELIDALIEEGKQFDTFFYPNRNHSIYGGTTRYHLYTMMTNFVLENL